MKINLKFNKSVSVKLNIISLYFQNVFRKKNNKLIKLINQEIIICPKFYHKSGIYMYMYHKSGILQHKCDSSLV